APQGHGFLAPPTRPVKVTIEGPGLISNAWCSSSISTAADRSTRPASSLPFPRVPVPRVAGSPSPHPNRRGCSRSGVRAAGIARRACRHSRPRPARSVFPWSPCTCRSFRRTRRPATPSASSRNSVCRSGRRGSTTTATRGRGPNGSRCAPGPPSSPWIGSAAPPSSSSAGPARTRPAGPSSTRSRRWTEILPLLRVERDGAVQVLVELDGPEPIENLVLVEQQALVPSVFAVAVDVHRRLGGGLAPLVEPVHAEVVARADGHLDDRDVLRARAVDVVHVEQRAVAGLVTPLERVVALPAVGEVARRDR